MMGRPPIGDAPISGTERNRRWREKERRDGERLWLEAQTKLHAVRAENARLRSELAAAHARIRGLETKLDEEKA
jgi:hypothetical protein